MVSHTTVEAEPGRVNLVIRGDVSAADREYARAKVAALVERFQTPVLFVRIKLTRGANPSVRRSALAQVTVELSGHPVRAQVAAESMREAVDLVADRLRDRLGQVVEAWDAGHAGRPHQWRRETGHGHRPERTRRPAEDREVIRHTSYSAPDRTAAEAVFEMESMDYDFHLFVDTATGQDSVVYRSEPDGYRLARADGAVDPAPAPTVTITVSGQPAPLLGLAEAQQRLDAGGRPFMFFVDQETGRGNVLYHRHDGHFGLVTPARTA